MRSSVATLKRMWPLLARFGKYPLCFLLLTTAVLILLHPIFRPGFLVYRDNPAHLAEAFAYIDNLRHGGSLIDGWSMSNGAGYPLLLYHPKTGFWLIATFHFFLSLSVVAAYKLVTFVSVLLPVFAVFLLLRRDSNWLASFFCSLLFLSQNNLLHYSLSGMASNALATGVLFIFAGTLFAFSDRPTHGRAIAAGLLLGLLTITHLYIMLGGVILWATVFIVFLVFSDRNRRLRFLFLLLVPLIGFLTSYFYTHQLVRASGWLLPAEGKLPLVSFGTVFGNLFWWGDFFSHGRGVASVVNVLGNIAIVLAILFAILGIAYAFDAKKKERGFYVRAVSILVFVGVSSLVASGVIVPGVGLTGEWLRNLSFLRSTKIHGYRFLILARAGMVFFSAYGLTRLMKDRALPAIAGIGRFSLAGKFRWPLLVPLGGSVFLAANLPFFFYDRSVDEIRQNPFFPARDSALLKTSSTLPTAADLIRVCDWLRRNGDDGNRRVFFQNTLGNAPLQWREIARASGDAFSLKVTITEDTTTHFTHLPAICPLYSGVPQIGSWIGGNLFPIERISVSESQMLFGSRVEDLDDKELVVGTRILQRLNVHYLVTCEPRLRSRLMSSRYFARKETFGPFDIFELPDAHYAPYEPCWAYLANRRAEKHPTLESYIPQNKIEVTRLDNRGMDISFENYATMVDLHVAVCHHPFWKAYADGKAIPIESDDLGLMKIPLQIQEGKSWPKSLMGTHTLTLRYVPDRGGSVTISLLSLILCIGSFFVRWHGTHTPVPREPEPPTSHENEEEALPLAP